MIPAAPIDIVPRGTFGWVEGWATTKLLGVIPGPPAGAGGRNRGLMPD